VAARILRARYRRNDPPPKFQLAVPLTVPAFMHTYSRSGTTKQKSVGDMALIAFYFFTPSRRIHIDSKNRQETHPGVPDTGPHPLGQQHDHGPLPTTRCTPQLLHRSDPPHFQSKEWQTKPGNPSQSNIFQHFPCKSFNSKNQAHHNAHPQFKENNLHLFRQRYLPGKINACHRHKLRTRSSSHTPRHEKSRVSSGTNHLTQPASGRRYGATFNRIPVITPILGTDFRVLFLQGCISLKNWSNCPLLRDNTSPFKSTCLLIKLK
jgi:hypothetical protein